jgi:hypothetical protein
LAAESNDRPEEIGQIAHGIPAHRRLWAIFRGALFEWIVPVEHAVHLTEHARLQQGMPRLDDVGVAARLGRRKH